MKPTSGLKRADSVTPSTVTPTNKFLPSSGLSNTSTSASNAVNVFNGNTVSDGHDRDRYNDKDNTYSDGHNLHAKIALLEKDIERRQESYISRERAYKMRIDELEEELTNQRQSKTGWMKSDPKINKLKSMQSQILHNVELVQDRTARIMQEQERDLLRAFRARLFDVQTELEKEKSKKDDGAIAWIERSRQLESEVEWAKEVADRLERVNQSLLQENSRLKSQFTSQEEDRNFLIKQLVAVKKDNARLRAEYVELENDHEIAKKQLSSLDLSHSHGGVVATGKNQTNAATLQQKLESEDKYKDINARLRKLLAEERKSLLQVRQNYAAELKIRTDMELLLRQCVEDVREEIARRHVETAQFSQGGGQDLARLYSKQPGLIPIDEFTQEDRERALELLLSQERVVSLIYAKTFPVVHPHNSFGVGGSGNAVGGASNSHAAHTPHVPGSKDHHRTLAELQSSIDMTLDQIHGAGVDDLLLHSRPNTSDNGNNNSSIPNAASNTPSMKNAINNSTHSNFNNSSNSNINVLPTTSNGSNASSSLKNISSVGSSSKLPALNNTGSLPAANRKIISR